MHTFSVCIRYQDNLRKAYLEHTDETPYKQDTAGALFFCFSKSKKKCIALKEESPTYWMKNLYASLF